MKVSHSSGKTAAYGQLDPVATVMAWHNRRVLAERIRADQVRGVGWVLLPFVAPGANGADEASAAAADAPPLSLRERAQQRVAQPETQDDAPPAVDMSAWRAAFSERLVPGVDAKALATFARAHGSAAALPVHAKPRRDASVDQRLTDGQAGLRWVHLQTASIEAGARRSRVFIGTDGDVLGGRLWSRPRSLALGLLPCLVAALAWGWIERERLVAAMEPAPVVAMPTAAQTTGPTAEPATGPATGRPTGPTTQQPSGAPAGPAPGQGPAAPAMPVAASEPNLSVAAPASTLQVPTIPMAGGPPAASPDVPMAQAAPAAAPAPQPAPVPTEGPSSLPRPSIRPRLDPEVARAARKESAALREMAQASTPQTASPIAADSPPRHAPPPPPTALPSRLPVSPSPSSAPQAPRVTASNRPSSPAQVATSAGPVFALVARTTRSRAASEILLTAMAGEAGRGAGGPRAEVLSAQGGYRASLWPFSSKEAAERVQAHLREAGLQTDIVEF